MQVVCVAYGEGLQARARGKKGVMGVGSAAAVVGVVGVVCFCCCDADVRPCGDEHGKNKFRVDGETGATYSRASKYSTRAAHPQMRLLLVLVMYSSDPTCHFNTIFCKRRKPYG